MAGRGIRVPKKVKPFLSPPQYDRPHELFPHSPTTDAYGSLPSLSCKKMRCARGCGLPSETDGGQVGPYHDPAYLPFVANHEIDASNAGASDLIVDRSQSFPVPATIRQTRAASRRLRP